MALSIKLANLLVSVTGDTSNFEGAMNRASGLAKGFTSGLQNTGKLLIGGIGAGLLAVGAGAGIAGKGLFDLAAQAAPLENLRAAFDGITASVGTTGDAMLQAFDTATGGMVSHEDAMMSFNKASQLVSTDFAQTLPDAMQYLGKVAAATGQDMGFMLDSLVTGVGRVSPMILDNLGIQVNITEATKLWAKENAVASTSILDNSKAIGTKNESLKKLEQQLLIAQMKQEGFNEKTKETTRLQSQWKIDELTGKIAEHRGEIGKLTESHGKTIKSTEDLTKSMTKAQQQEAILALTMKKLAENTAAMPDITDSAAAKMEKFKNTIKNTKDKLGLALVPALGELFNVFQPLIEKALPVILDLFEDLGPILETVMEVVGGFIERLMDGVDPATAFATALSEMGLQDVAVNFWTIKKRIEDFIDKINEVIAVIQPYIDMVWGWIEQNVQLEDVLIALGIAVASFVVPAMISLLASILPILIAIGAVILVVAILRKVWEEHGEAIKEKIGEVYAWLQEFIPQAIEAVKEFIANALEVIRGWWEEHGAAIMEVVDAFWGMIQAAYELAKGFIMGIIDSFASDSEGKWQATVDAVVAIVEWLWDQAMKLFDFGLAQLKLIFDTFTAIFQGDWETAWDNVKKYFENIWNLIKGAAESVWSEIEDRFSGFFDLMADISGKIKSRFQDIKEAIKSIIGAVRTVMGWISDLLQKLRDLANAVIPDWLQGLSPPPMANWLNDIADAAQAASRALDLDLGRAVSFGRFPALAPGAVPAGNFDQSKTVNLTINNPQSREAELQDYYSAIALL